MRSHSVCRSFVSFATLLVGLPLAAAPIAAHDRGAVYVATNDATENEVLVFRHSSDGDLDPDPRSYSTGGLGTGAGLGNQGGVVLSNDQRFLFVVNAGSDSVSVFEVESRGLDLLSVNPSCGRRPVSVTQYKDIVYVLNAGGAVGESDMIAGFRLTHCGELDPIHGSIQPLSAASTGPAQIGFDPEGEVLVVSEKATNMLTTFHVDRHGHAGSPNPQPSVGMTPFGFAFAKRGVLIVSEAAGGGADASSVSSYSVCEDGTLEVLDGMVPTTQTAACWIAISKDGHYAYTTNAGSNSVSGYEIRRDGDLRLLDCDGRTAETGATPIDMDFTEDGRNLYTLNAGDGTISAFHSERRGALSPRCGAGGLPVGANGLAAR